MNDDTIDMKAPKEEEENSEFEERLLYTYFKLCTDNKVFLPKKPEEAVKLFFEKVYSFFKVSRDPKTFLEVLKDAFVAVDNAIQRKEKYALPAISTQYFLLGAFIYSGLFTIDVDKFKELANVTGTKEML